MSHKSILDLPPELGTRLLSAMQDLTIATRPPTRTEANNLIEAIDMFRSSFPIGTVKECVRSKFQEIATKNNITPLHFNTIIAVFMEVIDVVSEPADDSVNL